MKPVISLMALALCCVSLRAADLSQAVADAARYESGASAEPLRQIEKAVRESAGDAARRVEVEKELIKLLVPAATFEARRFACTQLAMIGGDGCLQPMAELLKNPETTGIACLVLGSHPSPKANEVLKQALPKARDAARAQIIVTLGDRRDKEAVAALILLTRNADGLAAENAISSLGKIASAESLAALKNLRETGDPALARAAWQGSLVAADLLARSGDTAGSSALYKELMASSFPDYARRAAFEGALRLAEQGREARIVEVLHGKDDALKASAIAAIQGLQGEGVSASFAKEMASLKPEHQVLLIQTLAARHDAPAMEAIHKAVSADNAAVRRAAVEALGKSGDVSSVATLVQALGKNEQTEDRRLMVAALTSLKGGPAVDQAVAERLKKGGEAPAPLLISVLGKRANHASLPVLLEQAGSPDAATAKAAFNALGGLATPEDLAAVLGALASLKAQDARGPAESAVAKVLSKTSPPARRTETVAVSLTGARDIDARCSLLGLLPSCGDATALEMLKTASKDTESRVRDASLRALADWPDSSALGTLVDLARNASQDTERVLAMRGASRLLGGATDLQPADAAARFETLFPLARNAEEKKLLLSGLGRVHHPAALALAASTLNDTNVQAEAALAAVTIAPYVAGSSREATRDVLRKISTLKLDAEVTQNAANLEKAMEGFADFITAWQIAGPCSKEGFPGKDIFDEPFGPEKDPAGATWQPMPAGTDKAKPWLLDLAKAIGGVNCAAYARTWVYSDGDQPAQLELGSDDGVKAWLNDKVVIAANRGGDVRPGDQKAGVELKAGWNKLVLKVTQWTSGWGFCARVAKPDGSPITGLRFSPTPP